MYTRRIQKSGFILVEILIALLFWSIVFPSLLYMWFSESSSIFSIIEKIEKIGAVPSEQSQRTYIDRGIQLVTDSTLKSRQFSYGTTDWEEAFGTRSCRFINTSNIKEVPTGNPLVLDGFNIATDSVVQDGYMYITANSATSTDKDFYIIDTHDPHNLHIISSLNTGPGLNSIVVAGGIAYVGNSSVNSQVQAIDVLDPGNPKLRWSYKINGANSSTSPITKSIYFYKGYIFLGTEKTTLPELYMLDVTTPQPQEISHYEIGAGINKILVYKDKVFITTPLNPEVQVFDITNKKALSFIGFYEAPGSTGNGKSMDIFNSEVYMGRTVGGDELNILELATTSTKLLDLIYSQKVKATIDDMLSSIDYIYTLTSDPTKEFQIWQKKKSNNSNYHDQAITLSLQFMKGIDLPYRANRINCDKSYIYITMNSHEPIKIFQSAE